MHSGGLEHFFEKGKVVDWVAIICSLCISFVTWTLPSSATVPLYVFMIMLIFFILIVSKLIMYAVSCKDEIDKLNCQLGAQDDNIMPKLIKILKMQNGAIVFLTTGAVFFKNGMQVSIVYENNDVEQAIAYGVISNIQQNKLIQTTLTSVSDGYENTLSEIISNQIVYKNAIRIFPGQIPN
ncbi:hypothetical protein FVW20_02950 [Desulfovibrio oxamicus]|uniref:Uncharacterized protein n=1 Tax=Nitratidesulfovibrio oxamicus TaxID=32016 RepID=A0ABS0J0S9_9BACT|nr:hypothetical protein [Nitratidesulfovibrio oxamicus]MBG3876010.1 hypothetical protein [Nitratidesulfovibrio oxamicus]